MMVIQRKHYCLKLGVLWVICERPELGLHKKYYEYFPWWNYYCHTLWHLKNVACIAHLCLVDHSDMFFWKKGWNEGRNKGGKEEKNFVLSANNPLPYLYTELGSHPGTMVRLVRK